LDPFILLVKTWHFDSGTVRIAQCPGIALRMTGVELLGRGGDELSKGEVERVHSEDG
jgi:hypothetical protein